MRKEASWGKSKCQALRQEQAGAGVEGSGSKNLASSELIGQEWLKGSGKWGEAKGFARTLRAATNDYHYLTQMNILFIYSIMRQRLYARLWNSIVDPTDILIIQVEQISAIVWGEEKRARSLVQLQRLCFLSEGPTPSYVEVFLLTARSYHYWQDSEDCMWGKWNLGCKHAW